MMKYSQRLFAGVAAVMLLGGLTTGTVVEADSVSSTGVTSNSGQDSTNTTQPATTPADNNSNATQPSKTVTAFSGVSTKYKWTAGDKIEDQISLNSKEVRPVYLQKWDGKKYVDEKKFTTTADGKVTVTYPAVWYHHLHTTWRLYAPETDSATAAKSDKIGISTVRRYQIPKKYRQLHMKSLHLKGYYTSPFDKSLTYASTRSDYVKAFIKRGYQYKNAGTAWIDFTSKKPGTSVDCSGLIMQCMYATGIDPTPANPKWHATHEWGCRSFVQSSTLQTVSLSHLKRGDIIFYGRPKPDVYHVGIYLGNNKVLHSWPNWGVTVSNANFQQYYYAKRIFPVTHSKTVHERN
ncbi:NlpC/P60 family protein [Lactobacillus sp. ESL0731]|uniref:NlpC/P60 family protein n=1 Tax=unclassified Lactobacillus TaxID=2620435 RepID=UPI0023F99CB5|nr:MULTISPECIES: NlpC/P60 family protein [unclassified Lactobacillus]WEV50671.1 NlpC/P60 family protein [Lactobacillus sp. ESL0700]WEV61801.1 NlpC/P60 family protein [Lactobacillus sp. ESL0731]